MTLVGIGTVGKVNAEICNHEATDAFSEPNPSRSRSFGVSMSVRQATDQLVCDIPPKPPGGVPVRMSHLSR